MSPKTHIVYLAFLVLLATLLIFQYTSYQNKATKNESEGVDFILQNMNDAQSKFDQRLSEIMSYAEKLSNELSTASLDSTEMMDYLEEIMKSNPDIFGFGVCYEPYEYSESRRLFSPYWIRPEGKITLQFIEEDYDYTERDWYTIPLNNGPQWFEPPYFGQVSQIMMAEYSVPFYKKEDTDRKNPIGIVFINYSLEDITSAIRKLIIGNAGYGFMLSDGGTLIAHPQADLVLGGEMNIQKLADEWTEPKLLQLFEDLKVDNNNYIKTTNPYDGKSVRVFMKKIDTGGWRLGAVFIEEAFETDSEFLNKNIIISSIILTLIILIGCLYYLHFKHFELVAANKVVIIFTSSIVIIISFIWSVKLYLPFNIYQQQSSYPLTDIPGIQRFLHDQDSMRTYYHEPKVQILPTGVQIDHLEFDGSHNIRLSGIIWQRYNDELYKLGIKPELFFPETAPDAEVLEISQLYSKKEGNETVIGWHFRVEIRKQMEYGLYPVDREIVTLLIDHPKYNYNIQLIPDIGSYKSIITSNLPGVKADIVLPEWVTEQSYFDLKQVKNNSNLGVLSNVNDNYKYQLGFNLVLKRKFLWPALGNIVPLITIIILLFLALISVSKQNPDKKGILFSGFGFLELCAAFLFVAILTHIDLRSNLVVNYIIYMDYFYFHIYLAIITCSIAVVIFNKDVNRKQLLVVRYLFWPLLMMSMYSFTCLVFY